MDQLVSLQEIKEILLKFDKKHGAWPEDEYEGREIWHFIEDYFKIRNLTIITEDTNMDQCKLYHDARVQEEADWLKWMSSL